MKNDNNDNNSNNNNKKTSNKNNHNTANNNNKCMDILRDKLTKLLMRKPTHGYEKESLQRKTESLQNCYTKQRLKDKIC